MSFQGSQVAQKKSQCLELYISPQVVGIDILETSKTMQVIVITLGSLLELDGKTLLLNVL